MENPDTWGKAEHTVSNVIEQYFLDKRKAMETGQFRAGLSLARQITDALRAAGLLKEES
jgi:hypothetical protein